MSIAAKIRRAPLRLAAGAFVLNSGIGKLKADETTAGGLHGMATGTYPFLHKVDPKVFAKGLAATEIAVGSMLLLPVVPAGLAGVALTAFAGSLIGMYVKTPGMHEPGSIKPTQQGTAIAKDVWMAGMGLSLVLDAAMAESPITDDARHLLPHS